VSLAACVAYSRSSAGPIKGPFRKSIVLGNLCEPEAKSFFETIVLPRFPSSLSLSCSDEVWSRVYEVCGGNPGALASCAQEAHARRSWSSGAFGAATGHRR
jgi:hypothetical protein